MPGTDPTRVELARKYNNPSTEVYFRCTDTVWVLVALVCVCVYSFPRFIPIMLILDWAEFGDLQDCESVVLCDVV